MAAPEQQDLSSASQISDLVVEFISVVDKPATGKAFTLKSEAGTVTGHVLPFRLIKADDELQMLYGIVYPADTVDSHGHWASAATIRKACERFMRSGMAGNVDKQHNFAKQDAWVAECWIIRKGDPLFPDEPEGSWAAGVKVLDPDLWKACKSGQYTGFSLAGFGEIQAPADQTQPGWLNKFITTIESLISKKDAAVPITDSEKTDIAKEVVSMLKAEGLLKAAPPETPGAPPPAAPPPAAPDALAKTLEALTKAVEKMPETISDTVAKAVAKGAAEGGLPGGAAAPASFI